MNDTVVAIKQGRLKGVLQKSVLGPSYIAFKGIPFAAPPIGTLRFKDPEPAAPWNGVRDASKNAGSSAQLDEYPPNKVIGEEDCLYLNVYTKSVNQSKPVMFWIHGGAFVTGTGNELATKADYLIAKDVVLVSPNYRLGALGFLNLGHKVAAGNQGLKDLIVALKWVKENIERFGGDRNNVTIFGASAGGALVHALTVSPAAEGLFHKAILQSGTVTCPWGKNQSIPERSFKLASILGKDSKDPVEVIEFLRSLPYEKIIEAQSRILEPEQKYTNNLAFGVADDKLSEKPVLPCLDELVTKVADIPVMMGYASHEFLMFLKDTSDDALKLIDSILPKHVENLAGLSAKRMDVTEIRRLLKRVRERYFNGKETISRNCVPSLVDFFSDVYVAIPTNRLASVIKERNSSPVYLYKFSYVGNETTVTDLLVKERVAPGASHVDELSYLFYIPRCKVKNPEPPAIGTVDRLVIERLTRIWTDFAKTGNPTPRVDDCVAVAWKPLTKDELNCLEIGDELKMITLQPDVLSC